MTDRLVAGLRCIEVADLAPAFVLEALDVAEMAAVRAHLAGCPEAHAEVAELGSAAAALLVAVPQASPPAALGSRILEAARQDTVRPPVARATDTMGRATDTMGRATDTMGRATDTMPGRIDAMARPPSDRFGFLRLGRPAWAAAGLAAVLAIAVLGVQVFDLQRQRDELAAYERGVAAVLDTAAGPNAQLAVLATDQAGGPRGIAAVAADGAVTLAVRGLGPTAGSQVYEAWLIAGSNAPEPIGGFTVGASGAGTLQTRGTTAAGVVVALTLEATPGAKTPTLPIVVSGAAQPNPG
jgi:hypothetical protein